MANQNVFSVDDFDRVLDSYAGRQVQHVKVSRGTANISGQETLTNASTAYIKAYFMRTSQKWNFEKAGFFEKGDAVMLAKEADAVKKDHKVIADGKTYLVRENFSVPGVFDSSGTTASEVVLVYSANNLFEQS